MKVTLLAPVQFSDRKSKAGNSYRAADVQGLLHTDDGKQEVFAFMLMAPFGEQGTNLPPGEYTPVQRLRVDYRDRKLGVEVVGFQPLRAASVAPVKAA
jgi:hypothetical protein